MYEFLQDNLFLEQLDNLKIKEEFIKITVLSWKEDEIQEIQGKVIDGSLTIDGSSSLRRTANLTVFAEETENDLTQIDDILSINRKIRLEIGIVNKVPNGIYETVEKETGRIVHYEINYKKKYGDIIWFPLGVFVIFDPTINHNVADGVKISLTLKDKMCLLNGEAGGVFPAAIELHTQEQENINGEVEITQPTISKIIREVVNHWGEENLSRIIISDIEDRVKWVMRWEATDPLYYWHDENGHHYSLKLDEATAAAGGEQNLTIFEQGQDVGFTYTDFTYPGQELVADAGATITSILDQLIEILGNFEYFYDVFGNFRFQEIKNYLNTTYTTQNLVNADAEQNYEIDLAGTPSIYKFNTANLISAFSNAPLYSNIKNDFVVWGVKKDSLGNQFPIRYHLAIDEKPKKYYFDAMDGFYYGVHKTFFYIDEFNVLRAKSFYIDEYSTKDNFPQIGHGDRYYYALDTKKYYEWKEKEKKYIEVNLAEEIKIVYTKDWREELYYQGLEATWTATDSPYYFTELIEEWPKIYDLINQCFYPSVAKDPSIVDFYLDIIDSGSEVGKYNVQNIGRRSNVVQEDGINCVFEQDVLDVILIPSTGDEEEIKAQIEECMKKGQDYVQVSEAIFAGLGPGGSQNSAYQRVCELLYQVTNMNNSITLEALPIYYLEPNTRITVHDAPSGIYGDYTITNINLPLDINSQMSINASKVLQRI